MSTLWYRPYWLQRHRMQPIATYLNLQINILSTISENYRTQWQIRGRISH